jgi:choline-glycine betaine transporter
MNQRQLASVLFAVLGVFIAATRLPDLLVHAAIVMQWDPAMEYPAGPVSPRAISTFAVVATLLVVMIGLGLVVLRDRIAGRLFPSTPGHTPSSEVQAAALAVLGVYFVVNSIPGIMSVGGVRWASAVQALLGVGLFFGARGIAAFWSRSRAPGPARYE